MSAELNARRNEEIARTQQAGSRRMSIFVMRMIRKTVFSAFGATQLVVLAALAAAFYFAYTPWQWSRLKEEIIQTYPDVNHIDGSSLEHWFASAKTDSTLKVPVLLDVRSPAEFAVSHLPGARNVSVAAGPEAMQLLTAPELWKSELGNPVVVYCQAGVASAEVAERLQRVGFERVQMLDGGIFQWANDKRPLVDSKGEAIAKVHTGGSSHSGLLKRTMRSPIK
jgi:rhodanese-related sulfurtransferase